MNESKLIFYGSIEEIQSHILYILSLIEIRPALECKTGFYLLERQYGHETEKSISLNIADPDAESVLIYRYLSDEEWATFQSVQKVRKYYVLSHKHFDLNYVHKMPLRPTETVILCGHINSQQLKDRVSSLSHIKTNRVLYLKPIEVAQLEKKNKKESDLPWLFLLILKFLINPFNELKGVIADFKYSNLRILDRFIELLRFVGFCFHVFIWRSLCVILGGAWFLVHWSIGLSKTLLVKFGYGVRHILLMTGFKSFGFFVDTYHFLVRFWNKTMNVIYYKGLLAFGMYLYYQVLVPFAQYIYYEILRNFIYYKIFYFLYYQVGYYLYFVVFKGIVHFFRYQVRHVILMAAYKGYGVIYDLCTMMYRFIKLYLFYPVRKLYWFSSYQYNKRVKQLLLRK